MDQKPDQPVPDTGASTPQGRAPSVMQPELRFSRDGRWYQGSDPVTHPGIAQFFSRHLRYDEHHGCFVIERDGYAVRVIVEDAPFIVVALSFDTLPWRAELHDGTIEEIAPEALYVGPDDALYVNVRSGTVRARLSLPVAERLYPFVEEREGRFQLSCGGHVVQFIATGDPQ